MSPLMMLCLIALLSILCQWGAFRLRIPAILPLLICGLLLGPVSGLMDPDALIGEILFPLVSVAVAIILFEGALTLRFSKLKGQSTLVRRMVLQGMLVTFVIASLSAHWLIDLPLPVAALLGALVVVTGPTVIAPLLRSIGATPKVATILHWEGILIDPIGALLAVLVFEFINASQSTAFASTLSAFVITLTIGIAVGCSCGYLIAQALKRHIFPHYLQTVAVLTLMLAAFGVSNEMMHESGLLTVTVMGIWLANDDELNLDAILEFKETLSILLISALFILLAARLPSSALDSLNIGTIAWLVILLLVARPVAVWLCAIGSDLTNRERWLISWVAPRGIVAAAISALFALKLEQLGYANTDQLVAIVFLVIITTVVLQSLVTPKLVKVMGLQAPQKNGVLLFGAGSFSQAVATALHQRAIPVLVTDTHWDNISKARMNGLPVYWGNPVSEHADAQLDLSLISRVLVLSPYRRANIEVAYHYQDLVGEHRVYLMPDASKESSPRKQGRSKESQYFVEQPLAKLDSIVNDGGTIKVTKLTESYDLATYRQENPDAVPLFTMNPKQKLAVFRSLDESKLTDGWEVIALQPRQLG